MCFELKGRMQIVTVSTKDGFTYEGIYWPGAAANPKLGAVFVHGWTGGYDPKGRYRGFVGNNVTVAASMLAGVGISSLSAVNRGYHAPEFFNDSSYDIDAYIDFLVSQGCEKVLLLGHSLGGAKCAYYGGEVGHPQLGGVVLMSAIPTTYNFEGKEGLLEQAQAMIAAGNGHLPIARKEGETITTYEPVTLMKNFHEAYRGTTLDAVKKIKLPLLSFAAEGEWRWFHEVTKGIIEMKLISSMMEAVMLPGIDSHGYEGHENEVTGHILRWIERNFPN